MREHGRELADAFVLRVAARVGRPLTPLQDANVRFAFQIVLGTVNNAIFNRPGPMFIGQAEFVDGLAGAFRLVSNYDALMSRARSSARPSGPLMVGDH